MGIFTPPDWCYDPGATRLWLVAAMVGLAVLGIALLAQAGVLWRGMSQLHAAWWWRLPLVLPLLWAGVCAFYAEQASNSYRAVWRLAPCTLEGRCLPLHCVPPLPLDGQAQIALLGAVCLLLVGWLVLSALARRGRAA